MRALRAALVALLLAPAAHGQSQTERFELVCTSPQSLVTSLRFTVFMLVDRTEVTDHSREPAAEYEAEAYVNAIVWSDGRSTYSVDRFTGVLKVAPAGRTFSCEKRGGKKF